MTTPQPKIIKTTTKQTLVRSGEKLQHNKEEKVENLTPGNVGLISVVSSSSKVSNLFIFVTVSLRFYI